MWGGFGVGEQKRVQKALNFATRIVTAIGRRDTPAELGWLKVDDLIMESGVAVMRRVLRASSPPEVLRSKIVCRSDVSVRCLACRQARATVSGHLDSYNHHACGLSLRNETSCRRAARAGAECEQSELSLGRIKDTHWARVP